MKKQNVAIALAMAFSLFFSLSASAGSVLDTIVKNKEIRIGTSGTQPPMSTISKTGQVIGLDVDLGKAIGAEMGVEVTFVVMPFGELLQALKAGRVDMVISGMTATSQRNLSFAFVGPYYVSGKGILAKARKYAELKEAKGLNTPEVKIAALMDSTSQEYAQKLMPKAQLILTKSYDEAIGMLIDDKVDLLVADYPYCALSAFRHQDQKLLAGKSPLTFEPIGIAMPEYTLLINWVGNFMILIKGNGELERMKSKWLSGGTWIDQLP